MKINKTIAIAVVLFGLLVGGLGAGIFLTQRPQPVNAAPAAQQGTTCVDDDDVQHEAANEADDAYEDSACADNEADEANEEVDTDDVQEEHEDQADDVNEADEADETNVSPDQMGITAEQAQAAAEAANPGAKTLAVEIDRVNENGGAVIYEVELDNGIDVKVDAANGSILGTDMREAD
jgi:hypothetical protein